MARIISYSIVAKDKFSRVADRIARKTSILTERMKYLAITGRVASGALDDLSGKVKRLGRWMTGGSVAIAGVGTKAVLVAGRMEALRTSVEGVAGSAREGEKIMSSLLDFAAKTPFEIEGLGQTTKQLKVMGIATEDLMPKMQILGDIASISGGDVSGLALIYSQIKSRPTLAKQDVYQLLNRNIPITEAIAQLMNKKAGVDTITAAMVMNNSDKIPGEFAIEALETLNDKGNVAYQAMIKLSATTPGMWANVADEMTQTWEILGLIVSDFINVKGWLTDISGGLKGVRNFLSAMAKDWPVLTGIIGTIIVFFSVLGPILAVFGGIITHIVIMSAAMAALKYYTGSTVVVMGAFKSAVWAINTALGISLGAIALWVAGFFLVIAVIILIWRYWEDIENFILASVMNIMMWFGKMSDSISDMWGNTTEFFGSIFAESKSSVAVSLDINDPGNNIGGASATTSGPAYMSNTGANLMGVR